MWKRSAWYDFTQRFFLTGTSINETLPLWNEPNEGTYDQCGSMFYTGRLTQIGCDLKSLFICEHEVDLFFNEQNIV